MPEFSGSSECVGGDDVSGEIANDEAQRIALYADIERGGAEADGCGVLDRLYFNGFGAWAGEDRPGGVLGEGGAGGDTHADEVVAEGRDAQLRQACLNLNAVVQRLGAGYRIEGD